MAYPPGPWKVITAGTIWAVARTRAKRGETDICQGSQFQDNWKDLAQLIAGVPKMADYIVARAAAGDAEAARIAKTLKLDW